MVLIIIGSIMIVTGFLCCFGGLTENANYGSQFESIFRSGRANPGNSMIGFGIFIIVVGIILLIVGIVLMTNKKKRIGQSSWVCTKCGYKNKGMFCSFCGDKRIIMPQQTVPMYMSVNCQNNMNENSQTNGIPSWICECGKVGNGAFCSRCGKQKPVPKKEEVVQENANLHMKCCSSCNKLIGEAIFCQYCGAKQ